MTPLCRGLSPSVSELFGLDKPLSALICARLILFTARSFSSITCLVFKHRKDSPAHFPTSVPISPFPTCHWGLPGPEQAEGRATQV